MPSPQAEVHGPSPHLGSFWQSEKQPSNGIVLPSSQLSAPSILPSPHVVGVQVLGVPSHLYPISYLQLGEQPSPAFVLPSSQSSGNAITPSPHRAIWWQGSPAGTHEYPHSTCRQFARQPSPASVFLSSHASSSARTPSPQPGVAGSPLRSTKLSGFCVTIEGPEPLPPTAKILEVPPELAPEMKPPSPPVEHEKEAPKPTTATRQVREDVLMTNTVVLADPFRPCRFVTPSNVD